MSSYIEIPHYDWANPSVGWHGERGGQFDTVTDADICPKNSPAWEQPVTKNGKQCRPIIRCNCGRWCGIGAHHVHADGTVTASFYHAHSSTGLKYSTDDGCGWHVNIKLANYNGGEFPPDVV